LKVLAVGEPEKTPTVRTGFIPTKKAKRLLKSPEERLNKLERRFLERLKGQPHDWLGIQAVTLYLAFDCRYTPDFGIRLGDWQAFYEVKGPHQWEDGMIKLKMAATAFPFWNFYLCKEDKQTGEWTEELVRR